MADYDVSTYGERIAEVYDQFYPRLAVPNTEAAIEFLAAVAGHGRVLELGIGTGRIALPLRARGLNVSGIDSSPAMVKRLRAKRGGDSIPVEIGDFAELRISGKFSLIYVVFNTFFGILSQDAQLGCFERVARRLTPDGVFVIEAFVPDQTRFDRRQRTSTLDVELDHVTLEAAAHDPVTQTVRSAHVMITETGTHIYPVKLRYAWPAELDLMARIAGMRLRERWGGWRREPFTAASPLQVSVYEMNPAGTETAPAKPSRVVRSGRPRRRT